MSLLIIAALFACETQPPAPALDPIGAEEVAAAAAAVLCRSATTVAPDCRAEGATATLAGHSVSFTATVDGFTVLPGRTIGVGASAQEIAPEVQLVTKVQLYLDGRTLLEGTISHAAADTDPVLSRAQVLDEAAQRFMVGHALGLVDALVGQDAAGALSATGLAVTPQTVADGTWQAYASYPVLRGQGLDPNLVQSMGPQVQSVLSSVGPYLDGLDPQTVHAIKVKAIVGGGGGPGPCGIVPPVSMTPGTEVSIVPLSGTVTIDGKALPDGEKPAICALSQSVGWPLPRGGSTVEWTQVVVVRPAGTQAED